MLLFLGYAATLAALLPIPDSSRNGIMIWNTAVASGFIGLAMLDSRRPSPTRSVVRDWLPMGFILYAFREMGLFTFPDSRHRLEQIWLGWDHALLGTGFRRAIESLGPVFPALLEIAYSTVYVVPALGLAVLYVCKRRERAGDFDFILLLGVLLTYAQFPFWPSQPPRLLLPGQDMPSYTSVFREFNWWILGHYSIHSSVFPSGHVAAAYATALGLRRTLPEHKAAARWFFFAATVIAISTVYGRYHYFADAAAGLAMALLGAALAWTVQSLPARLPGGVVAQFEREAGQGCGVQAAAGTGKRTEWGRYSG
jgi:membrane-associated phospholipid phosphatase